MNKQNRYHVKGYTVDGHHINRIFNDAEEARRFCEYWLIDYLKCTKVI